MDVYDRYQTHLHCHTYPSCQYNRDDDDHNENAEDHNFPNDYAADADHPCCLL